jgi:AraC-like DNA-binding protein
LFTEVNPDIRKEKIYSHDIVQEYLDVTNKNAIELINCRRFDQTSSVWISERHQHEDVELIYFLEGRASIDSLNGEVLVRLYDVLIHPQNVPHKEKINLNEKQEIINLFFRVPGTTNLKKSFVIRDDDGKIRWICKNLHQIYHEEIASKDVILKHLTNLLWLFLSLKQHRFLDNKTDTMSKLLDYIHENYMTDIGVPELAKAGNISPSYLHRIFKDKLGLSPIQYILKLRLEMAKRLIGSGTSISDVASLTGFKNQKYFSSVFKKFFKISPSQYKTKETKAYDQFPLS